jgi:hypothetical protein
MASVLPITITKEAMTTFFTGAAGAQLHLVHIASFKIWK